MSKEKEDYSIQEIKIKPDPLLDQFFLTDKDIINKIIGLAQLKKNDIVLEIGSGTGVLTREIAKKAGRVISFEVDSRFKSVLKDLPKNVDLYFGNALKTFHKYKFNKVVSNIPYSLCEPFLHKLIYSECKKGVLVVPQKFYYTVVANPVFNSFFDFYKGMVISKKLFYPVPRTDSVIISIQKKKDPLTEKNLTLFLRQYLYYHENQISRNALREGIIKFEKIILGKNITKNQARDIVYKSGIEKGLLEKPPNNFDIYEQISEKISFELLI